MWLDHVYNGDCLDVMGNLPSGSFDMVVTSPPYNLRNSTGNGMKNGRGGSWSNAALLNGYSEEFKDNMPHSQYVQWQRECLSEMLRLISNTGVIFYNHKWRVQGGLMQDRHDIVDGFPVRQIIIWERSGGLNHNPGYFLPTYEVIYMICKPKFRLKPGAGSLKDIWRFSQDLNNPHPAPFPIELPLRCIGSCHCNIVLDPFMGSGTTALAAIKSGIHYVGIEKYTHLLCMNRIRELGSPKT